MVQSISFASGTMSRTAATSCPGRRRVLSPPAIRARMHASSRVKPMAGPADGRDRAPAAQPVPGSLQSAAPSAVRTARAVPGEMVEAADALSAPRPGNPRRRSRHRGRPPALACTCATGARPQPSSRLVVICKRSCGLGRGGRRSSYRRCLVQARRRLLPRPTIIERAQTRKEWRRRRDSNPR